MEWPSDTRTPARVSWRMKPGGTHSGASVTSTTPFRDAVSGATSSGVGARICFTACTPGFSGDRNGPSR